jgi:maleate cis-trans isomerase
MGTIAWLKPGAVDEEALDVFRMVPRDVRLSIFTNTLAWHRTNAERFDAELFNRGPREQILSDVRGLAAYGHPDFVAVTGDLIQATMGVEWDRALRDDIRAAAGADATTAMTAVTDALTFLGAKRVSVATPFIDEQNECMRSYLEDAGFEVVAIAACPVGGTSIKDLKAIPAGAPLSIGRDVFNMDRSAQAMYIPCPVWEVSPYIEPLEDETGIPILSVMNAIIWRGLHSLGHPGGVNGYGRVLRSVLS